MAQKLPPAAAPKARMPAKARTPAPTADPAAPDAPDVPDVPDVPDALDTPDTPDAPAVARPARRLSARAMQAREERATRTREQLMLSAAQLVGKHGYRDTSVQRITVDAGVAQGTFYLYFGSRQALFEELLPHFGLQMLEAVRARAAGARGFFKIEEIGVRAVLDYLTEHPWFWRLLNEAEGEAPLAWARHHEEVIRRYLKFLKRAQADGELASYAETELETLAQLLVAARDYIYRCELIQHRPGKPIPDSVIRTYRKFIEHGLGRREPDKASTG
jgi:AcrR family transcriptional regulator